MDDQLSANIGQLPLLSKDGKSYDTDVANVEGVFRLVQSIPSKKAEPFKKWLARVGFERLQEIENPDLAIKRAVATYRAKGTRTIGLRIVSRIRLVALLLPQHGKSMEWKNLITQLF